MTVIFLFSAQSSSVSNDLSKGVLETILEKLNLAVTAKQLETCNLILRKIAHFSLYFLLGVSVMGAFRMTVLKPFSCFCGAVLVCILFAASDELHQALLGTRNGNGWDVLLDSCGAACGAAMFGLRLKHRKSHNAADGA